MGKQAVAERPAHGIFRLAGEGFAEHSYSGTQPPPPQITEHGISDHRLDQPVRTQPSTLPRHQRVPPQLAHSTVQPELVTRYRSEILGKLRAALEDKAERDVVGCHEGAQPE